MTAQPDHIHALDIPVPETDDLDPDLQKYFTVCQEKLGMVPNVLRSYAAMPERLRAFIGMYNDLMLSESGLSKLEREMIATAVSSENKCFYCVVAHGAGVRELSGDPALGELMAINYRAADISERQRAMLDFAVKMTRQPDEVEEADREALRDAGFSDHDIMDIACIAGFFNMTNRVSTALDRMPNPEYHAKAR
ncbi:MAG: peroxidase-related enzyme [Alphaproteobacteria bacterium]|nr:peroxidase-related enzyme [Alphaproteobacteria bacterium]